MKNGYLYKIEKKVPIPFTRKKAIYPLDKMGVGDSFVIPGDQVHGLRMAVSQRHLRKEDGKRYTVRKQDVGYRCWRTD